MLIRIGDTKESMNYIKEPSGLSVALQDIDSANTTRMADGGMVRDRIIGGAQAKRKLSVKYNALMSKDLSDVLKTLSAEFFWVEYPDPYEGTLRTAEFYSGDRSVDMYNAAIYENDIVWQNLSFNLIER